MSREVSKDLSGVSKVRELVSRLCRNELQAGLVSVRDLVLHDWLWLFRRDDMLISALFHRRAEREYGFPGLETL